MHLVRKLKLSQKKVLLENCGLNRVWKNIISRVKKKCPLPFKNFHSLSALFYPFGSIFKILFFGGIAFHIAYTIYIYASERKIIKIRSPILTEMAHCTVMYSWESHSENSNFVEWKNNFMNFKMALKVFYHKVLIILQLQNLLTLEI